MDRLVSPQNLHVEVLTASVLTGPLRGIWDGACEIRGWGPHHGIRVLISRDTRELALFFSAR